MTTLAKIAKSIADRASNMNLAVSCMMDGDCMSEIAVVSEAPGQREEETKKPLTGQSGYKFFDMLRKSTKLTRHQVYVTNTIKKRMLFRDVKQKIARDELTAYETLLHAELAMLDNLRFVIVCGDYALNAIVGEQGIMKWAGSNIPATRLNTYLQRVRGDKYKPVTAICLYNPAYILREPHMESSMRLHMSRIKKVLNGDWPEYPIEYHINPTFAEAMDWMDMLDSEDYPISIDIESVGQQVACFGLTNDPHEGMCIPFRDERGNFYTAEQEYKIRMRLSQLFHNPKNQFVAQNGSFDSYYAWCREKQRIPTIWYDTLLAHHTLYPRLPHNLGFLTTQYTPHPFYKDDKDAFKETGDIDKFWRYNVKDICITLAVQQATLRELEKANLDTFFFDHVMRLQPKLVKMTVGGVLVDAALKGQLREIFRKDVEDTMAQFHAAIHEALDEGTVEETYAPNPNSPDQMRHLFFNLLGLVGRGKSTDARNKDYILRNPKTTDAAAHVINLHTTYKEKKKFLGTYVESVIDDDGRMRCEYKQFGVARAPGRLSSSKTMWGSGGNLQNQPDAAQEMYIADPGYVFVYFDLAQAEARLVAWLADIATWKEQFERARIHGGYDCHVALAADMFDRAYDDVPTFDRYDAASPGKEPPDGVANFAPTLRFIAKRCRHGLNYRMDYPRLAETTGLSIGVAADAYKRYHRNTPELRIWWADLEREARDNRVLYNVFGRRLPIMGIIDDAALESIVAFKPQSSIGDHVASVIYRSEDDDDWPSHARMALNIHDANIALVREDQAMSALRVMKRHAERPIMVNGEQLIIPADCKISVPDENGIHRWSNMKPVEVET